MTDAKQTPEKAGGGEMHMLLTMNVAGFALWMLLKAVGLLPAVFTLDWWVATVACYALGFVAGLAARSRK